MRFKRNADNMAEAEKELDTIRKMEKDGWKILVPKLAKA